MSYTVAYIHANISALHRHVQCRFCFPSSCSVTCSDANTTALAMQALSLSAVLHAVMPRYCALSWHAEIVSQFPLTLLTISCDPFLMFSLCPLTHSFTCSHRQVCMGMLGQKGAPLLLPISSITNLSPCHVGKAVPRPGSLFHLCSGV